MAIFSIAVPVVMVVDHERFGLEGNEIERKLSDGIKIKWGLPPQILPKWISF